MRILITSRHSPFGSKPIGGVQTWIRTVVDQLGEHDVFVWEAGQDLPAGRFDLGIVANYADTHKAWGLCDETINVSHGIIPAEKPGPADAHVFTSEGVRDHWKGAGPVIGQPIDIEFWSPGAQKRTLFTRHSYRAGLDYLPSIAREMGLGFAHLQNESAETVRDTLQRSKVVIATGRAALEAMACGAAVVIADDREYQGPLLDEDTLGSKTRNYSGRGGIVPAPEDMRRAIVAAINAGSLRRHVEAHHDARLIVKEILCCTC